MRKRRSDYNHEMNDFILDLWFRLHVPVSKIKDRLLVQKGISMGETGIRGKIRLYEKYYKLDKSKK